MIVRTRFVLLGLVIAGILASTVDARNVLVETNVEVVDEKGMPLPGITVSISYLAMSESKRPHRESAVTGESGHVRFRGRGYRRVSVYIHEEGYYGHRENRDIVEIKDGRAFAVGEITLRIVLKKIRNPIVMISDGFFRLLVPEFGAELGYDFFRNDWVAPYGEGEHSDVLFKVDGYFNSERDRKSTLVARFPNPGDGMVAFEANLDQGGTLKSDHSAPGAGYESEWSWNISVREDPKMNRGIFERDYTEDRGYYLRLRTEYDEAGNIVSCHYGKIYGDFRFDGVWPRDSSIVCEAYYVNPNPKDRNVEARTGETLIPDPDLIDRPRLP